MLTIISLSHCREFLALHSSLLIDIFGDIVFGVDFCDILGDVVGVSIGDAVRHNV